nr:hypothetical protein [Tanacetum cinerariifolium]
MTVNAADHRSTAADHGGDRRSTVAVNAAGHRSTAADHGGDRRSTAFSSMVTGPGIVKVEVTSEINMVVGKVNNVVVEKDQFLEELYSLVVRPVPAKMAVFLKEIHMKDRETMAKLQVFEREIKLNARINDFEPHHLLFAMMLVEFLLARILDQLTKIAYSSCLQDKMNVWFILARIEDKAFAGFIHDRCAGLRMTLRKNQRLIAELEALGERGDVARSLDHIREVVARDSGKLGVLEQLLVGTHTGISLKDGYVADMDEKE